MGVTIGPMIGGVLSHPVDRWPEILGKIAVFCNHPYFLPCFAAAVVPLGAFVFTSSRYFVESINQHYSAFGNCIIDRDRIRILEAKRRRK